MKEIQFNDILYKHEMKFSVVSSDFSFAERAVIDVWIWLWFIHRVWSTDRFASLQWHKICNFDLKSVITLLIFLMLPFQAIFDITWTYLKYYEGYVIDSDNKVFTKPIYSNDGNLLWLREDLLLKTITEYMLAFCFAFQIGTLALMQAFWSHLSSQMGGKPFMRSWKFRFYVGWVFASMFIFPLARNLTNKNEALVETVPQTIFSTQMFVIVLLGIKNGRRLNNLLNSIQHNPSGHETILRIRYFIDMNECLTIGALFISGGILIIIFVVATKHPITSKFFLDIFLIHINFGSLILWATMILIIYPRYYITGTSGAVLNSTRTTTNGPQTPQTANFRHASIEIQTNRHVITTTVTTTTPTTPQSPYHPSIPSKANIGGDISVEKSINKLLEEQNQQIEIFRHKTSASISSTITTVTSGSNHAPISPLIPPPPLSPPLINNNNNK